jgi:hypothetical protein
MSQNHTRQRLWNWTRRLRIAVLFAALSMLTDGSALAGNQQAKERAARKACLTGDYTKGVAILSDLFIDSKDPTYIFNQGRCFEQNRRYEDAIGRFEEYLRAGANTNLPDSDKAAAEKHIADCRESVAKLAPPVAPGPEPARPVVVTPPPAPTPVEVVMRPPSTPTASSGAGLRTAGIVAASVGGAAVIAGVILNVKVNSIASDMESVPGGYSPSKESDRKNYQTMGWVSYSVGAGCIAAAAVLYIVGLQSRGSGDSSDPGNVSFVPAGGPGQVGAVLTGAF